MASIRKRKDSYQISVSNGRDMSGRQIIETTTFKPISTTPKAIQREVEVFAQDYERRVREGRVLSGERMTFSEFAVQWKKDWAEDHLTTSQSEQYESTLKSRVYPSIGNVKIAKITPLRVQDIITRESKIHAPKTVRRIFTAMNSVFRYAYRMSVIQENPCSRCELPRLQADTDLHYFTLDQAKAFLQFLTMPYHTTCKAHVRTLSSTGEKYSVPEYSETRYIPFQFQAYFMLAIYGGFRRGEMIALTWKDIDFDNRTISVNKAIASTKEGPIVKEPKTKSGIRTLIMPESCFEVLKEWKVQETDLSRKLGSAWNGPRGKDFDQHCIFIQDDGERMVLETPYKEFKKIIQLYNAHADQENNEAQTRDGQDAKLIEKLPDIRLHDLRHTSATLLLSENVDIETVSHRMGHSKASVTLDVYGHALETKDKTASETLDKLFSDHNLTNICLTNPEIVSQSQKMIDKAKASEVASNRHFGA